jgi:aminopeptidase N
MIAARLVEPLGSWRRYQPDRGAKMTAQLARIAAAPGLSRNVLELVGRSLEG